MQIVLETLSLLVYALQVVPVPRQALAAASLAIGPEQDEEGEEGEAGKNDKPAPAKLCEKMVRLLWCVLLRFFLRCGPFAFDCTALGCSGGLTRIVTVNVAACTIHD